MHGPVVEFIQNLYEQRLEAAAKARRKPFVLFTAGGTGAGKSSFLDIPEGRALHANADVVYDGTLSHEPTADANIQRALDTGGKIAVVYTYRDPVEAFTGGVLKGAMEEGDRKGRTVPLDVHARTHVTAQRTVKAMMEKYAGNPRVEFIAVDNTHGKGNARVVPLTTLPTIKEDGLKEKLENALDEEYRAGRITREIRDGAADTGRNVPGEEVTLPPPVRTPEEAEEMDFHEWAQNAAQEMVDNLNRNALKNG